MAALLSFPFSFHTSPPSADHLHHPLHLPTQHVPFKLFLSYSQAPEASLSRAKCLSATGRLLGCRQRAQSKLSPLLHSQEGGKCPPCTSHTARLTHNVIGPEGLKASSHFLLSCFFHCSRSTRRVSTMGAYLFGGGGNDHSSTEGKTGGQQHDFPRLWAVLPKNKRLSRSEGTNG